MKNKLISLLFILVSSKAMAIDFPVEISEYIDDNKIDVYLKRSDINDSSKWQPFSGATPLSMDDALTKVKAHLDTNSGNSDNTTLIGIELKRIPHHKDYWHYLVKVQTTIDSKRHSHFYVVLMDGKVISAFKEPEAIK